METAVEPKRRDKVIGYTLLLLLVLVTMPMVLEVAGWSYLPTREWAQRVKYVMHVPAIIVALSLVWLIRKSPQTPRRRLGILMQALTGILGYVLGLTLVLQSVPMLYGFLAGQQVFHEYTVDEVSLDDKRHCPNPINVRDLPFFFNKVCGFSDDTILRLSPGDPIFLLGPGSWMGIFPREIRYRSRTFDPAAEGRSPIIRPAND